MSIVTPAWVRDAVFYQVFPDRFARSGRVPPPGDLEAWDAPPTTGGFKGGDLYGVADHLDHIADLGANAIYLNPIFVSAVNHRYHVYDYYRVDPLLGGDEAFRHLLDAAHARGIRVVIDGVFNHCGRGFLPFHAVLETGGDSPYRDWFFLNPEFLRTRTPLRAYGGRPGPELDLASTELGGGRDGSASLRDLGYQAWWDLPALPKLNVRNPETREYLLGAAEHWIRLGADGWRLDVPEDVGDADFWREFRARVRSVNPDAYILAEIWFPTADLLQGDRYDATMNYPFLIALVSYAGGAHLDRAVAAEHGWIGGSLAQHDGPGFATELGRLMTAFDPAVTAAQYNLVGSHDTPRILSIFGGDEDAVRLAALIQATVPGAPAVYYGDEIGMTGSIDPAARAGFPWSSPETWNERIRGYLRAALGARRDHAVLRHGTFRIAGAGGPAAAWLRTLDDAVALVAVNNGEAPATLQVDAPELAGRTLRSLSIDTAEAPVTADAGDGRFALVIPARAGRLFLA
jgi:cyclomaltodextrinase